MAEKSDGEESRRAASKRETREALVTAALAEFSERGLDAPSLDAICARAGFTRGAFYVHFRDREDLMVGVLDSALGSFLDAMIASGGEGDDLARTIDRFAGVVSLLNTSPRGESPTSSTTLLVPVHLSQLLEGVRRSERLRQGIVNLLGRASGRLEDVTRRGQEAHAVRGDVDARQVGSMLVTLAIGVLVAREAGLPLDPPALRRVLLRLLTEGNDAD
ncbi:MAG: TetR/AcrR family transcriptional regulator [Alphaproteobacteria bacterium]